MIARYLIALAAGAALFAADEPKAHAADLADLKAAVAAADKRGENVGGVKDALAAFEKALAAPAAKAGEAPPELAALREAVEFAARKGENVEAVSKELGRVEKALTGRAYERPKFPEPKVEPEPEFPVPPRRPGGGFGPGGGFRGGRAGIVGGDGFNSTAVTVSNGNYTIKASKGDVTYVITGNENGPEVPKIVIRDGEKKVETDDMKKVPDEYKAAVERLLKLVSK